jgi:DNA polymerase III sliding clamp (beta) subunit (PCNA family)
VSLAGFRQQITSTKTTNKGKNMNKEITIPVSELKEALPGLTKVISKGRSLPVLQSVKVARNREGVVTLQSTDLDSFVTFTTRATQPGVPVEVLVPVEHLTKAVKCSSPKEDIGLVAESKDKLKLRYNIAGNCVEQTVSTLPANDYPPVPVVKQPGVQLEPRFGLALKEALACCSDDASRYVLRGACLDVKDKKFHYVVGTNGRHLYSANSFCFSLQKSVIIPDSKFLTWSDFMDDEPCFLSVEPGKIAKKAKEGQPAQEATAAWVKLESPRWTFVTKEIEGEFPNWKQAVPTPTEKWTKVILSKEAIAQLLVVVPNLPGNEAPNHTLRLRIDRYLNVEGPNKEDATWTSVPVQEVNVYGEPVTIGINRHYLLNAIKFGLNQLEIQDSLSPMVFSNGGKRMVVMPINLDAGKTTVTPVKEPSTKPQQPTETAPPVIPEANEERNNMPRTAKTQTETTTTETSAAENNGAKSLVDQVEQIKEGLKNVVRDLTAVIDSVKLAEKEKRSSEKEIDAIRTKLRQIQNVTI